MPLDTNSSGIKSVRIFFSYSTIDKAISGQLKKHLELLGYEVFLAHEDIQPGVEWEEEILKNLERSDVLVAFFSPGFKNSNWTDQEVGFALAKNKLIVPLQINLTPYGFIGKIQGLEVNLDFPELTANQISNIIKNSPQFRDDIKNFIINSLANSRSFEEAKVRAKKLDDFDAFTQEEIKRLFAATAENGQINSSYGAREVLKKIFTKYNNFLSFGEYSEIMILLTPES